ncbi:hypothetical protein ACIBCT_38755 [Streptosporangium sp. NPDC050855]|uniref:hypothetical protein n=1 Tax=Streptosporangium sp. NPDC050855 TaxID=3366194 RepID=UPI00379D3F85
MREDDPMRGGAVWCEHHGRWECSKRTKVAPVCHGIAIAGVDRCRMHAGEPLDVAKAKGEAVTAWSALTGRPVISHNEAVMGMLQVSWLRAHLYAGLLRQQFTAAQEQADAGPGGPGGEDPALGPGRGLVGHTRSAAKDIGIYVTGESVRALTALEGQERDRVVRYAKAAHDMGIAEQQVRLAEQQGVMLADVIRGSLDEYRARVLAVLDGSVHADAIRRAWPEWMEQIVPAQIAAVAGVDHG